MAEPYLKELSHTITELELPASDGIVLECKHFFSGAALYANGVICASFTPAGFALKLPAETRGRLMKDGEGHELRYFEGAPVKREYVVLANTITEDRDRVRKLLQTSIDYVTAL